MAFDFKQIDTSLLKKLADPKAAGDLNVFLEKMPQNAGQTVLIAAGIAWAMTAALGLYSTIQARQLTELRAELQKAEALTPVVPKISDAAIPQEEVQAFAEKAKDAYKGLTFTANGSTLVITSDRTGNFSKFREAIGHVQNGGSGWRVTMDKMCVGRECGDRDKIGIALKINKVSVENPAQASQ